MSRFFSLFARAFLASCVLLLGAQVYADESLTYDYNRNIETRTLPGGTTTYQYDDLDRVQNEAGPAKTQSFSWDPNSNRLGDASGTHTYTANSNRQATIAGQSVTLDEAGNITQARNLGFVWNTQGQLIEVRQGSPSGAVLATYSYDYQNRRIRKVKAGSTPLVSRTTIYSYDQYDRLIGEFNGDGSPLRTYIWRDNIPLAVIDHGGTERVYYPETDHLGSPIAARDKDGKVVWRWASEAFGATAPSEDADGDGNAFVLNLRFPGQYYDAESGLHYNHHRYYDPKIGRYLSSDPIGLAGGENTYSYVENNPISFVDPDGLTKNRGGNNPRNVVPNPGSHPGGWSYGHFYPNLGSAPPRTASYPVGNSTSQFQVPPRAQQPGGRVCGRDYSGHAFDQMQARGIPPSVVSNTIGTGAWYPGNSASTSQYYSVVNDVTVIVNHNTGNTVTVRWGPPSGVGGSGGN